MKNSYSNTKNTKNTKNTNDQLELLLKLREKYGTSLFSIYLLNTGFDGYYTTRFKQAKKELESNPTKWTIEQVCIYKNKEMEWFDIKDKKLL